MLVSIIIVSYNVRYYIAQCLHSVAAAARAVEGGIEVFVVDNASSDNSVPYLSQYMEEMATQEDYPKNLSIRFIANKQNMGFGRANNQAALMACGRYILFLNPDTFLSERTLTDCVTFAEAHEDLGALGVAMLRSTGQMALESRRGMPTPWVSFCKVVGLSSLFPRSQRFGRFYLRYLDERQEAKIDIVSGAFFFAPKKVLDRHGLFDESFFMYCEDTDLAYRLRLAGLQNYYLPTPILHYKGESTRSDSYKYIKALHKGMIIFHSKYYPHSGSWFRAAIRCAIIVRAGMRYIRIRIRALHRRLVHSVTYSADNMLLFGNPSTFEAVQKLAEQNGIGITCVAATELSCPDGHLSWSADKLTPYNHIAYDTTAYSYLGILTIFRRSNHRHHIATYFPGQNHLITGGKVYLAHDEA